VMPKKAHFASIIPAGIGKAGHIAKHTAPYGMGSEPRSFFFPVPSFRSRQGPTNFFTGPGLAWSPLSIAETRPHEMGQVWPPRSTVRLWGAGSATMPLAA
jgi:hypothetical protein